MQGKRIPYNPDKLPEPGDYFKADDGTWYANSPNDLLANLARHHVEEHDDGTISVVPGGGGSSNSILVDGTSHDAPFERRTWHGYIYHGRWEEC